METPHHKIDARAAIAAFLTLALFVATEGLVVVQSLDRPPSAHAPPEWFDGLMQAGSNPKYR